jgi:hypothetical protein
VTCIFHPSKPDNASPAGFFVRNERSSPAEIAFLSRLLFFQIAPLLFDTVVTLMTVWKAFAIRRRNGGPSSRLIQTFLREG